jgi:hypothetical protein
MAAVLVTVRVIDRAAEGGINVAESHFLLDSAGTDAAFMPCLDAAKLRRGAPVHGPDAQLVTDADDPDRHQLSCGAVAPH